MLQICNIRLILTMQLLSTILHSFSRPQVIAFDNEKQQKVGRGFQYKGKSFVHHSSLHSSETAFHRLSGMQSIVIVAILVSFIGALVFNWHLTITVFVAVITFFYFTDLLFNLYLIIHSYFHPAEISITTAEISAIAEHTWPMYTVMCPLYKEAHVVPQFVKSMSNLDYPKDKLQVMLLLEEDDKETVDEIRSYTLPAYFTIVVVPHSFPKTKPKACNYGLMKAVGEYTVIYDAEDVPDPLQLKKAVIAFTKAVPTTLCIQAKLNFYNPHQNLLTRFFTAEYSLWFDLVLTGLQSIGAPIPLGGTSNHFKTQDLHRLKGWDSFNVTEDADLGMRLAKRGYTTAIIDSVTLEEANSSLSNWFAQRSRWIKGYMQTYLVHMRNLKDFSGPHGVSLFFTFQLIIGGKIMSMFINPLMWMITISYFVLRAYIGPFVETFFPLPVLYMGVFSLVFGNFLYLYYYLIGCIKHEHDELVKYIILVPLYWLAMSVAAWVAFYKLLTAPHHWSKTKHGLHLSKTKTNLNVTPAKVGAFTGKEVGGQRLFNISL